MTISEFIKKRREELNLSQRKLATLANINHTSISKLESGLRTKPTPETLKALSEPLQTSYEELLSITGYPTRNINYNNIKLIRGSMTYDELSKDIENFFKDPFFGELYSPKYLKQLEEGKEDMPEDYLSSLASYANVKRDFFFRENTIEDLERARKIYNQEKEQIYNQRQQYTDMINKFKELNLGDEYNSLFTKEGTKYLKIAKELLDNNIDITDIEELIYKKSPK